MFCSWLCRILTSSERRTKAVKTGEWRIKTAPFLIQATLWSEVVVRAFAALNQTRWYHIRAGKIAHPLTNLKLPSHLSPRTRLSKLNEVCAHLVVIVSLPDAKIVRLCTVCRLARDEFVFLFCAGHFSINSGKVRLSKSGPVTCHVFSILTSTENNYVLGRHLCLTRAEVTLPYGGGGRGGCWGIGGVHSPVKVQPSLRFQWRELIWMCFPCKGPDVLAAALDLDCTDQWWALHELAFSARITKQVWQITGGLPPEPRWLVNKVKLQKENWTFWKKYIY